MNIQINTSVVRPITPVYTKGKVLVVLKHLKPTKTEDNEIEYNTTAYYVQDVNELAELRAGYQIVTAEDEEDKRNDSDEAVQELRNVEYLLNQGVNTVLLSNLPGTPTEADLLNTIGDTHDLGYSIIVGLEFNDSLLPVFKDLLIKHSLNAQLLLAAETLESLEEFVDILGYGTAKIEVSFNKITPNYRTVFNHEGLTPTPEIQANFVTAKIKSQLIIADTPHLPVAGENTGLVPEATRVLTNLTKAEKEKLQALGINVLINKKGLGAYFVSQNTMYPYWNDLDIDIFTVDANGKITDIKSDYKDADTGMFKVETTPGLKEAMRNPLIRSHVVTQALQIKQDVANLSSKYMFETNNEKTWNLWQLGALTLFNNLLAKDAIETKAVILTGMRVMTQEDILNHVFKGRIAYVPNRLIEQIIVDVEIHEDTSTLIATVAGGLI